LPDLANCFLRTQSLPMRNDFGPLRERPFVRDGDSIILSDRMLLIERAGDQLLRMVKAAMPVRDRQDLHGGVLGTAVEMYVSALVTEAFPKSDVLVNRLTYPEHERTGPGGGKAPDCEIHYPGVHPLLEVKG